MSSDILQSAYRHAWWSLVVRGLLGVSLGSLIIWRPIESVAAFAIFIAVWALLGGIVQIVHAFQLRDVFSEWWMLLMGGIVGVAFGFGAFYYYPGLSLTFAVAWTAWWLLLTGGASVYVAIQERRLELPWGWTMAYGLAAILTSALAFMNPPATLVAIMGLLAGFGIVSGIALLVGAARLASVRKSFVATMQHA